MAEFIWPGKPDFPGLYPEGLYQMQFGFGLYTKIAKAAKAVRPAVGLLVGSLCFLGVKNPIR